MSGEFKQEAQEPHAQRARRHHRAQQVAQPVLRRRRRHRLRPEDCALVTHRHKTSAGLINL